MIIKRIRIQNFRTIKDQTIEFDKYTCFVGPNGAGKSTVLTALNIFFRDRDASTLDLTQLTDEDFCFRDVSNPIRITVTFGSLSDEAKEDFKHYYRSGELSVSAFAKFDPATKKAVVEQKGERNAMPEFASYFASEALKVDELKLLYETLRSQFPDIPKWKNKGESFTALNEFEANHVDLCKLIESGAEFYGFTKGSNLLNKYVQWIFIPAVKDASEEATEQRNTALGKLLARVVRGKVKFEEEIKALRDRTSAEYESLIAAQQDALVEVSKSLSIRFQEWSHPDTSLELRWQQDEKSIQINEPFAEITAGESQFKGQLPRFGHGLQRSYVLALLQEQAATFSTDEKEPTLLLAIEEPELYQHPPQVGHMSDTLKKLSDSNAQVFVVSHNPGLVSGEFFEDVRVARREKNSGHTRFDKLVIESLRLRLRSAGFTNGINKNTATIVKLHQELQPSISEMFFCRVPVFVEGLEDRAYIVSHLILTNRWDTFRRLGCHIVVAGGKSHLIRPYAIACELGMPSFLVFDSDSHDHDPKHEALHRADNSVILSLADLKKADPLPSSILWANNLVMWQTEMGLEIESEADPAVYKAAKEASERTCGQAGGLQKNSIYIAELLNNLLTAGHKSAKLDKVCQSILDYSSIVTAIGSDQIIDINKESIGGVLESTSPANVIVV